MQTFPTGAPTQAGLTVDLDLIRRYDRPGPRYTSYPTAPRFTPSFAAEDWERHLRRENRAGDSPLSLYFHVPFCDTLCWFCGCTMMVQRRREPIARYVSALQKELRLYAGLTHPDREVVQVHFGGGTPTHLSPPQIREIGRAIRDAFRLSPTAEVSVEIDPRELTEEHVMALSDAGFNRASIGVQDFDPRVQKAVNRIHSLELVGRVIGWLREVGIGRLNLDLIYGLPLQTPEGFADTLQQVLAFDPDRLAVFSYAHVPWMKPHQTLIREADLPRPEEKLAMLKQTVETLTASRYQYIGMDHFARWEDDLSRAQRAGTLQRNFQGYSTHGGADIQAFGMSAISQLPGAYAQHTKDLDEWHEAVDAGRLPVTRGLQLTQEDRDRRHIIMRLMCDMRLDFDRLSIELRSDFRERFSGELAALERFRQDGLIHLDPSGLEVTDRGRLLVRNVAMAFDAYLEETDVRYSRTV